MEGERWMEGDGTSMRRFILKEGQTGGDWWKEGEKWVREKERGIEWEAKCPERCVCVHSEVAHSVSHTVGRTYCKPRTHTHAGILTFGWYMHTAHQHWHCQEIFWTEVFEKYVVILSYLQKKMQIPPINVHVDFLYHTHRCTHTLCPKHFSSPQ